MFTCPTCKNEWPENYCPICARTIGIPQAQRKRPATPPVFVTSNVGESDAKTPKPYSVNQKLSELTGCLRWFAGLFALNIVTFWGCFLFVDQHPSAGWGLLLGFVTVGALGPLYVYKLSRIVGSRRINFYSLFVLMPPFATVALILLCGRTLSESAKLGYRIALFPPRIKIGLSAAIMIAVGFRLLYLQALEFRDHAQLKKSGVPIPGTLKMVTICRRDFIPVSKLFRNVPLITYERMSPFVG